MQGLSRLSPLAEERKNEIDELVKEGQSLSERAAKGLASADIERWQMKCSKVIAEVTEGHIRT